MLFQKVYNWSLFFYLLIKIKLFPSLLRSNFFYPLCCWHWCLLFLFASEMWIPYFFVFIKNIWYYCFGWFEIYKKSAYYILLQTRFHPTLYLQVLSMWSHAVLIHIFYVWHSIPLYKYIMVYLPSFLIDRHLFNFQFSHVQSYKHMY